MTGQLEDLSVAAWRLLLRLEQEFPPTSVVPHGLQIKLHAIVHHLDETVWDVNHHPHLEGRAEATRVPTATARHVSFTLSSTYTVRNADGIRVTRHEVWGPTGHAPLSIRAANTGGEGFVEGDER